MNAELNSAVRSRTSTQVCWSDFWRRGRGPPRLCRYRGRKPDRRAPHRRCCDRPRRNAIDGARLCSPTPGFPPRLRYSSPRFDAWRMRFDDGLEHIPATAASLLPVIRCARIPARFLYARERGGNAPNRVVARPMLRIVNREQAHELILRRAIAMSREVPQQRMRGWVEPQRSPHVLCQVYNLMN